MSERTEIDLALPWAVRPDKYDDWGAIRDAMGRLVCHTATLANLRDLDEFRAQHGHGSPEHERGPEDVAVRAEFIVVSVNAHTELVVALAPVAAQIEARMDGRWLDRHLDNKHKVPIYLSVGQMRAVVAALAKAGVTP